MTTDRPEPMLKAEITLLVCPGYPQQQELNLRVSPDQALFLRACLDAEGLHTSTAFAHAKSESWLEILTVGFGSDGAITALVVALQKFLERHKGKSLTFGPDGQIESMTGYTAKEIETVLAAALRMQQERDKNWAPTAADDTPSAAPADDVDRT